jgi:hypothetical protein
VVEGHTHEDHFLILDPSIAILSQPQFSALAIRPKRTYPLWGVRIVQLPLGKGQARGIGPRQYCQGLS